MIPGEGSVGGGAQESTVQYSHASFTEIVNINATTDTRPNDFKSLSMLNGQTEEATAYLWVGDKFSGTSLKLIVGVDTGIGGGGEEDVDYVIDVTYIHGNGKNVADIDESIPYTLSGPIEGYQEFEVDLNHALAVANCLLFVKITRDSGDEFSGKIKFTLMKVRSE